MKFTVSANLLKISGISAELQQIKTKPTHGYTPYIHATVGLIPPEECRKSRRNRRRVNTPTAKKSRDKPIFYEGELYSEEYKRKFKTEYAGIQVVKDPKDKSKLVLCIEGKPIGE